MPILKVIISSRYTKDKFGYCPGTTPYIVCADLLPLNKSQVGDFKAIIGIKGGLLIWVALNNQKKPEVMLSANCEGFSINGSPILPVKGVNDPNVHLLPPSDAPTILKFEKVEFRLLVVEISTQGMDI